MTVLIIGSDNVELESSKLTGFEFSTNDIAEKSSDQGKPSRDSVEPLKSKESEGSHEALKKAASVQVADKAPKAVSKHTGQLTEPLLGGDTHSEDHQPNSQLQSSDHQTGARTEPGPLSHMETQNSIHQGQPDLGGKKFSEISQTEGLKQDVIHRQEQSEQCTQIVNELIKGGQTMIGLLYHEDAIIVISSGVSTVTRAPTITSAADPKERVSAEALPSQAELERDQEDKLLARFVKRCWSNIPLGGNFKKYGLHSRRITDHAFLKRQREKLILRCCKYLDKSKYQELKTKFGPEDAGSQDELEDKEAPGIFGGIFKKAKSYFK